MRKKTTGLASQMASAWASKVRQGRTQKKKRRKKEAPRGGGGRACGGCETHWESQTKGELAREAPGEQGNIFFLILFLSMTFFKFLSGGGTNYSCEKMPNEKHENISIREAKAATLPFHFHRQILLPRWAAGWRASRIQTFSAFTYLQIQKLSK